MCLWSLLNGILVVITLSLIQERVTKEMLGRMTACWMFASSGMIPLAQLGGGLLASVVGVQTLFAIAAGIALIGAMVGLSVADLRRLD
jgi:MFS family permease